MLESIFYEDSQKMDYYDKAKKGYLSSQHEDNEIELGYFNKC
jgi:hypothetical protein